ncbi:SGNH/GDSL hydrolase family protein [Paenibacillus sp. JCM 10914]|uniref:SGNH/GDSL hydrolase family protein n=1 Tax=Paenibacillus sp. JCM 10914 TaxID=1236974 RepID=UPI0003CC3A17|nr:SGNH/GDSL hydrolase family protein [Paenibacillus sp. JCM 10914]GAE07219.1 lipase/acylhydrolase family protein [Paenibacillus sp. JCM 10914]
MNTLQQGDIVLFQGDSITDCGRDRNYSASLGHGYPLLVDSLVGMKYPELNVTFLNRGISGNRVVDLNHRWQEDCIDLKPDWVSIYIGINDTWRRYDSGDATSAEDFKAGYRQLLERTKEALDAKLILVEPFVVPVPEDRRAWREDLDPKIHAVRELAVEYGALLVPLDGLFAAASARREAAYWAPDGVHPSPAGHGLIAKAWLDTMGISVN